MKNFILSLLLVFLILLSWSCENETTGTIDPSLGTPLLLSAGMNHTELNIDTDGTGSITPLGDDNYRVTLVVSGKAVRRTAASSPALQLQITKSGVRDPLLRTSVSALSSDGDTTHFQSTVAFTIKRVRAGALTFDFSLSPSGNTLRKTLVLSRGNSTPRIMSISQPDTVQLGHLPSTDSTFLISVAVADSDGVADISSVSFLSMKPDSTFANNGDPIPLLDDGSNVILFPPNNRSGDLVQGDGIYSIKVRLVSFTVNPNPPRDTTYTQRGNYTFSFFTIDNAGAMSDTSSKVITVR